VVEWEGEDEGGVRPVRRRREAREKGWTREGFEGEVVEEEGVGRRKTGLNLGTL